MSGATFAVVVNWNGGDANLACVASLLEGGLPPEQVVFVDNGSTDGSLAAVRERHPHLRFLVHDRNEGYARATNRGIDAALGAGATRVWLVNNDLTAPPETLSALEAALDADPGVGVVGPRVLYLREPERVWAAGGRLTFRHNLSTLLGHGRPDGPRWRTDEDVDYVPGCAMLVRREVFERVGRLEESYFAYHEDVEFCLLARRAGFRVRRVGSVAAFHDAHLSTGGGYNPARKYMMAVNTIAFLRKHGTPLRWLSFLVFDVLTLPAVWLVRAPRGEGRAVLAKARGTWDGLRGRTLADYGGPERPA